MIKDSIKCDICKHKYLFLSTDDFKGKFEHFIWSCEILAEIEKCVSIELAKSLQFLSLKWSDFEKEVYK